MSYSLRVSSHYSLCRSIVRADKLVERAQELGITTLALTDINSMSGAVDFIKQCEKAKIKWIIGVTLSIVSSALDEDHGTLTLLAKNLQGWKLLLRLVSKANTPEFYEGHPRISLSGIKEVLDEFYFDRSLDEDVVLLLGGDCSMLLTSPNYPAKKVLLDLQDLFNDMPVYMEIDKINGEANRELAKDLNLKCIPANPVYYLKEEDHVDYKLMLCSGLKIKRRQLGEVTDRELYFPIKNSHNYLQAPTWCTEEEIKNGQELIDSCEDYRVFSNPRLPQFNCPKDLSEYDYLTELCRVGWKNKIVDHISKEKEQQYVDRVKEELGIIKSVDKALGQPLLSRYFLITQDYIVAAKTRGEIVGVGRGSVGGSLVAYLLNITNIDPIRFNLVFSRFFNAGRIKKDKFSLPDIDSDFCVNRREDTIKYITEKYGHNRVGQVVTFGRLQGRGALKEILRINEACTMDEMNQITSFIPDEAKIAGDLQEMEEEGEIASIILWALRHNAKKLSKWCYLDEQDRCQGEFAKLFEQAIRLEGTLKTQGKHAAAVIVSAEDLIESCPLLHNKSGNEPLCGFEYESLEEMGLLKCDILGVAALDKIQETQKLIKETLHG